MRNADLITFLERKYGFTFVQHSGAFRCQQHQRLAIKADRRSLYWHSQSIGGYGALDFLMIAECMPFREADYMSVFFGETIEGMQDLGRVYIFSFIGVSIPLFTR